MNTPNARKHSDSRLETRPSRTKSSNATSNATDSLLGSHNCSTSATRKRKIDSCDSSAAVSNLDADSSGGDGSGSTTSIHQSSQAKFSKHDEITSQALMPPAHEYLLLNYIMTHDEDYNHTHTPPQLSSHTRTFCEGLGDQNSACVHRFEVFISDSNVLSSTPLKASLSFNDLDRNKSQQQTSANRLASSSFFNTGYAQWKAQKAQIKKFTFDCELGDKWIDSSLSRSCKLFKSVKNSAGISQVIEKLSGYGVRLTSVLSRGKFSHVFKGNLFSVKNKVAIKIYDRKTRWKKDQENLSIQKVVNQKLENLPEELSIQWRLKHQNIVQLLNVEMVDHHLVAIMELCDRSNLQGLIQVAPGTVLDESICRKYFFDMLEAVCFLHGQNVVHRDIRCDNFLVAVNDRIKLCDFSRATHFSNGDALQTVSYSQPPYSSPEILEKKPHNPKTSDIWALGVCLHFLLTSKLPFISVNDSLTDLTFPSPITSYPARTSNSGNTNPAHDTASSNSSENQVEYYNATSSNNATFNTPQTSSITPFNSFTKQDNSIVHTQTFPVRLDPLTLMKKGIDLKVLAPSVLLSAEAIELLKGVLHYVLKVRYTLNRVRSSVWMKRGDGSEGNESDPEKPHIGNHYMVSSLKKYVGGERERRYKEAFEI